LLYFLVFEFFEFHDDWACVAAVVASVVLRQKPHVKSAGLGDVWACASWAEDLCGFSVFDGMEYLADVL